MAGIYQEFLGSLIGAGVAKTSHFQVTIPIPLSLTGQAKFESGRALSLRCEATDLPGRQLVTQDNRIYGPVYKTPYQSLYQEVTLNFLETQDMYIRKFFELWVDGVFSAASNRLAYPNTYRRDITITQFDISPLTQNDSAAKPSVASSVGNLAPLLSWHLISAFPSAINQMPVSWTEDGFHRVSVTIAYEYYVLSTPTEPKKEAKTEGSTTKRRNGSST